MFAQPTVTRRLLNLTSPKNPLLKDVRRAVDRGSLTSGGLAVAESFHLLIEALRSSCEIMSVLASESAYSAVERCTQFRPDIPIIRVADDVLASVSSTETTQGVIALVRPPSLEIDVIFRGRPLVLVLDRIQDPGNAGTILRAAEAFGASGALILKGTVNPWNPKAIRGSAGSVFRVPLITGLDEDFVITTLENRGVASFATMPHASLLVDQANFRTGCAVIIGNEGGGIGARLADSANHVSIPTAGVESLNAAVAAGIILYEAARQRRKPA